MNYKYMSFHVIREWWHLLEFTLYPIFLHRFHNMRRASGICNYNPMRRWIMSSDLFMTPTSASYGTPLGLAELDPGLLNGFESWSVFLWAFKLHLQLTSEWRVGYFCNKKKIICITEGLDIATIEWMHNSFSNFPLYLWISQSNLSNSVFP